MPRFKDAYHGELDRAQYGLLEARVCDHRGMIWATWNFDGPDFYEFMGDMLQFQDSMLEATDGGDGTMEVLPGVQKWVVPCNWKFPGENSIGDHYHAVSHVSVELVGIGPGGRGSTRHGDGGYRPLAMTAFPATGHGSRGGKANPDAVPRYPFPPSAIRPPKRGIARRGSSTPSTGRANVRPGTGWGTAATSFRT